jgi:hypothetical protein
MKNMPSASRLIEEKNIEMSKLIDKKINSGKIRENMVDDFYDEEGTINPIEKENIIHFVLNFCEKEVI